MWHGQLLPDRERGAPVDAVSRTLSASLWLGVALLVLPLLLFVGAELVEARSRALHADGNSDPIAHAVAVITTARDFERTLEEAERAERTYFLTGQQGYLKAYREGIADAPVILTRLQRLAGADPQQTQHMSRLEDQLDIELSELRQALEVRQRSGADAAQRLIRTEVGFDAMRAIGEVIDATMVAENALLTERLAHLAEEDHKAVPTALGHAVVALTAAMLGAVLAAFAFQGLLRADRARGASQSQQRRALEETQAALAQSQQALEDTRTALAQSQKRQALGRLAGGIAHDFNNFLQVIRNEIELVQHRLEGGDSEVRRCLAVARRSTDRAAGVMQRLLGFFRGQSVSPRPTDLNGLVSDISELLQHSLGNRVAVRTVLGDSVDEALVDSGELETAILNLAANARDAMDARGQLTIETGNAFLDEAYAREHRNVVPGRYLMVAVSDTGTGMSREVIEQAFDPFFTTKEQGQGTGLGLSQVFDFVSQSHGHVEIDSAPGAGTTVRLYLQPALSGTLDSGRPTAHAAVLS